MKRIAIWTGCTMGVSALVLHQLQSNTGSKSFDSQFIAKLRTREQLCDDVQMLGFSMDTSTGFDFGGVQERLGKSALFRVKCADNGNIYRSYTPIVLPNQDTDVSLAVKRYKGGYFSNLLHTMKISSPLYFFGLEEVLTFHSSSDQTLTIKNPINNQTSSNVSTIYLICHGSAAAPMYQISTVLQTLPVKPKLHTLNFVTISNHNYLLPKQSTYLIRDLKDVISNVKHDQNTVIIVSGSDRFLSTLCGAGHEDGVVQSQPELGGLLKDLGFDNNSVFRI